MGGWRIFYEEGTFDSTEGSPADAAPYGVIAIVQRLHDEAQPQVIYGSDFYWWRDEMWWGGELTGLLEHCSLGGTWVKQGRMIRTADFKRIIGEAADFAAGGEA